MKLLNQAVNSVAFSIMFRRIFHHGKTHFSSCLVAFPIMFNRIYHHVSSHPPSCLAYFSYIYQIIKNL
uniref:Uncharacterized protein n=3 Tax=Enterobacteriaceae TaxID=543 RepID=A0A2L1KU63_ECOLX|nr:Hypothetical protein pT5282-CTXM_72 [Enterobacter cloacae]AVE17630.1 Hypothetical protein [Klebsiella pneumoniae]AVE26100.1 hypothetical protein [Escherichia coli]UUC08542.1 hypothetical protein [Klebsiella pneumoniae]